MYNYFMDEAAVTNNIRVMVADDHPLVRLALKNVLDKEPDIEVIAEAEDGLQAVEMAKQLNPDVAIMDISMPRLSGLEATRQIRDECPGTAVLVLTVHTDNEHIFNIMNAGATGYLTKSAFGDVIAMNVRMVASGETVMSPEVFRQLLKRAHRYNTKPAKINNTSRLTPRELDVLKMVSKGMSNRDIAKELDLSIPTIKNYLAEIFSKLEVHSRAEAVISALRANLITLDD